MRRNRFHFLLFILFFLTPMPLLAMERGLPGDALSLWWALPFCGMLTSLALFPLIAIDFWESHYGKMALGWSFLTVLSLIFAFGFSVVKTEVLSTLFHHYFPFVIMVGALYTISGGIWVDITSKATPAINTGLLALGMFLAGWIGTTGASMLLIRPFLHINQGRQHQVHLIIFFIFLVSNIGGLLTPLGDPPLFLGFLNGISFFWPLQNLSMDLIGIAVPLLIIFYGFDTILIAKEDHLPLHSRAKVKVKGGINGLLFLGVIGLVLLSGVWKPHIHVSVGGIPLELQDLIRDAGLVGLAIISWLFTSSETHKANHFSWEPLKEVAKLFFGIFMTVIPVVAILGARHQGVLGPLMSLLTEEDAPRNMMYFWLSGGLSSFLDNAPTYLVFFHLAGGEAPLLMTSLSQTLEAISLGSVFMGAMTYIGNAPNFMVKAIAERHKIPMPSFFGYMAWSASILLPLFLLLSWWRF